MFDDQYDDAIINSSMHYYACMYDFCSKKDETKMGNENILEKSFNKRYIYNWKYSPCLFILNHITVLAYRQPLFIKATF